jgi:hypothetical protein
VSRVAGITDTHHYTWLRFKKKNLKKLFWGGTFSGENLCPRPVAITTAMTLIPKQFDRLGSKTNPEQTGK